MQDDEFRRLVRVDWVGDIAQRYVRDLASVGVRALGKAATDAWKQYLDKFAPEGVSTHGVDDLNDAYRHYMSAAELSRTIGPDLTFTLGDLNEKINSIYSLESTKMDYHNNDAGIAAGRNSSSGIDSGMNFISDVAGGRIQMIDSTGRSRPTRARDLPGAYEGAPIDRGHQTIDRPDDMRGGQSDMNA